MFGSRFKWLLVHLLLLGVVVEINASYRRAIGVSEIPMPGVKVLTIPEAFQDTITEVPLVRAFDGMTLTTGTVVAWDTQTIGYMTSCEGDRCRVEMWSP